MASQPYLPLYTGDWKKDPQLSMCSAATRGIWIDLLCSIHDGRIGQVTGTAEQLSRLGRCDSASLSAALHDLQANQAANISEREGVFTVICRRMKKAAEISLKRQEAGSKGGANNKQRQNRPDTDNDNDCQKIIEEYCKEIGLPVSDGTACFNKWIGNGWTNRGESIKDWRATIRSWRLQGYLPSQRAFTGHTNGSASPAPKGENVW